MPEYRLYFLDGSGAIAAREDFSAANDEQAIECAAIVFNACSDRAAGYEVWSGRERISHSLATNSSARLDAVRDARQEHVIALEEALRDSHWSIAESRRLMQSLDTAPRRGRDAVTPDEIVRYIRAATGTEMMSLQLIEHGKLKLRGTHGFNRRFIDFFDVVADEGCACGAALKEMQQLVVPSVESSIIFAGQQSLEELRAAGVGACASTPLLRTADGTVLGMFSIHKRHVWTPDAGELDQLKALARQISAALADPLSDAAQKIRDPNRRYRRQ